MQSHDAYPDLPANLTGTHANGATATPVDTTQPYVHPTIPPRAAARRAVRRGVAVSPAHVGQIRGRQTEPLRQREGRGLDGGFLPLPDHRAGQQKHRRPSSQAHRIPGRPGEETRQGGKDRKSNTYVFLGQARNWKPLPTERPGTDPWVALAQARRENEALRGEIEELQAELARLMNGGTIAHPGVTDGGGGPHPEQPSHSYETADPSGSTGESGAIAHSELSNGSETVPLQQAPHSYRNRRS